MSKQGWFLSTLFLAVTTAACSEPVPTGPAQPPALRIFPGAQSIGLMLGGALRLSVTLTGTHGELLPIPPSFALISRNPTVITIDSVYVVHAKAMGETWVVGSLEYRGQRLADSIDVSVLCTLELGWSLTPRQQTIHVGESFTPAVTFTTCGGQLHPVDTVRWSASDTTIVQVDSMTGRTTGRSPGQTVVRFRAAHLPARDSLPVTVIAAEP